MKRLPRQSYRWLVLLLGLGTPPITWGQEAVPQTQALLQDPQASHPLDPALKIARSSLRNIQENVHDYTALFAKRCRVDGVLPAMQYAKIKILSNQSNDHSATPKAVYLDFLSPSSVKGREVLWVDGKNDGKLIAHEVGFKSLINVNLDPNGYIAMRGQRHPITEIGIENIAKKLVQTGERDRQHGECEVQFFKNAKVGEADCTMLQVTHPIERPYFDFYRAQVYFDNNLNVPIRYVSWSWPEAPGGDPVLEEEYTYLRLTVNTGLTDQDFEISNAEYRFR